jgi:hypothetical protein
MKNSNLKLNLAILVLAAWLPASSALAQGTTEVTASLLSQLQNPTPNSSDTFTIRFSALNGGLQIDPTSAWTAAQVESYWTSNARTLLTWTGAVGATTPTYRAYGLDTEDENYAGAALATVFSSAANANNQAFALITNSDTTAFAILDFGFDFANPADGAAYPFGAFDILPINKATSTLWYGNASGNGAGTIGLVANVPEPSSMSLMLFGATALVALRRLRKNV